MKRLTKEEAIKAIESRKAFLAGDWTSKRSGNPCGCVVGSLYMFLGFDAEFSFEDILGELPGAHPLWRLSTSFERDAWDWIRELYPQINRRFWFLDDEEEVELARGFCREAIDQLSARDDFDWPLELPETLDEALDVAQEMEARL